MVANGTYLSKSGLWVSGKYSPANISRDSLVFGAYAPGPTTVGPLPGTVFTYYGTGPTYQGKPVDHMGTQLATELDTRNGMPTAVPLQVNNAADWSDGTHVNYTVGASDFNSTLNAYVVMNKYIWGTMYLGTYKVLVVNCVVRGGLVRGPNDSGYINGASDNLNGSTIRDTSMIGRPIRVPETFNGTTPIYVGRIDTNNPWSGEAVRGANFIIERTHIMRTSDGIGLTGQLGNRIIRGCWIHRGGYVEWWPQDGTGNWTDANSNVSAGSGYYNKAANGSTYTHADAIQFNRGKHDRIYGNTLGNYLGGPGSGGLAHNADVLLGASTGVPSNWAQILLCEDLYNSCFQISQEVDGTDANRIEDVVMYRNFLGGCQSTVNWPIQNKYSPANPMPARLVMDNWDDYTDPGIALWHNTMRLNSGTANDFLIYLGTTFPSHLPNLSDNLYTDGTAIVINRG